MKVLGSSLILGAAFWGWWVQRRERTAVRRVRLELLSALGRMAEEIRLTRTPMPDLLEAAASDCSGAGETFFRSVSAAVREGETLGAAWKNAARELPLEEEERRALEGLTFEGDEERLCRAMTLCVSVLQRRAEETEKRRQEEEKRWAALWGCAGAMTVIVLL